MKDHFGPVKVATFGTFDENQAPPPLPTISSEDEDEYSDVDDYESDYNGEYDNLPPIDIRNLSNPQKLAKYAEQIFSIAQEDIACAQTTLKKFFNTQKEITAATREHAIQWLFTLQEQFDMTSDTLFESAVYLNTYLTKTPETLQTLQLATVTCIWIASKVEDRVVPKISELKSMCSNDYEIDDFIKCERKILESLDYRLNFPTSKLFLRRLQDAIDADMAIIEVSCFFCDLSLIPLELIDFPPIVIASACVCLGKICLDEFCPTKRILAYAHLCDLQSIKECAKLLLLCGEQVYRNKSHYLYKRYTNETLNGAITKMIISEDLVDQIR